MKPLLSFNNLSFGYSPESPCVLKQLNLSLEQGSVTALLGPNGAGKTTLLHIALGWLQPQSGCVKMGGRPLREYPRNELGRQIGLVPQSESVPFEYTVLEYVLLGRAPYLPPLSMPGIQDMEEAQNALMRVGLRGFEQRSMLELSGGERQLVLIARSLAQRPRLLLLDEPTSHLDLANKSRLLELLRELQKQGITLLLTTHDPELAALLSTHVILIGDGRVVEAGTVEQVLTAAYLSQLYGIEIKMTEVHGQKVIVWR